MTPTNPTTSQVGSAILTRGGTYFDYLQPAMSKITPEDIAHGLANICRFSGHTSAFYSVAQHCYLTSKLLDDCAPLAFEALMHDAAEAYVGDVPTPLKQFLPDYQTIEAGVDMAIRLRFGLPPWMHPEVKIADRRLLRTEREDLMPRVSDERPWAWLNTYPRSQAEPIKAWKPSYARAAWLDRFHELRGRS